MKPQELSPSPIIQELTFINFAVNRDQGMTAENYGRLFRNFPVAEYEARYLAEVGARRAA